MDKQVQDVIALMYQRGERDGLNGLGPSSTNADYWRGYNEGRRIRAENSIRYSDRKCGCDEI